MTTRTNFDDINAIKDRFLNIWDNAAPLIFEGEAWKEEPKIIWARFVVEPKDEALFTIGATLGFKQHGFAFLQIFIPDGEAHEPARIIADRVIKGFRQWHSDDGVIHFTKSDSSSSDREPGYFTITVDLKYESDH